MLPPREPEDGFFLAYPVYAGVSFLVSPVSMVAQFSTSPRQSSPGVLDLPISLDDRVSFLSLPKPLKFYDCKIRTSRLSKLDASLFAKTASVLCAPPVSGLSKEVFSRFVGSNLSSVILIPLGARLRCCQITH